LKNKRREGTRRESATAHATVKSEKQRTLQATVSRKTGRRAVNFSLKNGKIPALSQDISPALFNP
jgi:hypothetical protein